MKSKEEQELIIENIICFAGDNRMYFERKEYITKMMNAFKYYVIKEFKESLK
jgi:hypothetical protein